MERDNLNTLYTVVINEELNKLSIWLSSNKLTLNTDNSHYVIFHRARHKQTKLEINLSNISLKRVSFTQFLGVIIGEKVFFTRHISDIKNTILKAKGITCQSSKIPKQKIITKPLLCVCIFISHILYRKSGHASDIYLDALLEVQEKILESLTILPTWLIQMIFKRIKHFTGL